MTAVAAGATLDVDKLLWVRKPMIVVPTMHGAKWVIDPMCPPDMIYYINETIISGLKISQKTINYAQTLRRG
jgi:hypothetical protein